MAWDVRSQTTTVAVSHDGESAEVVIRKLSEGDKQDMLSQMVDGFDLGTLRRCTMEQAIVSWTIPVELSPDAIASLPAPVGAVIYDAICEWTDTSENPPT